jgi:ubiquinone/menaquinone biosynthesis C-methylase UbiE
MKAYYHARAAEYDQWWLGVGRFASYDRPGWEEELAAITGLLRSLAPAHTLDVACGTGFITQHLRGEVVGLDQSEAMVAIARDRMPNRTFVVGDALALPFADGRFQRVFSSFFYCHLEEPDRTRFLDEARRVGSELIVMGSAATSGEVREGWEERVLNDGSRWQVFKRLFEPAALARELRGEVLHAGRWFVAVRCP